MPYTLGNLTNDVNTRILEETGTVSGSTVVTYANEGLRRLRRKFDIPSAGVISQMSIMTGVQRYALPYDGFKDFVSLQDNFFLGDSIFMRNVPVNVFWEMLQSGNTRSEYWNGLTRTLLFNLINPPTASATLNNCEGVTTDGTWVASGDASGLGTDTLFFRAGSSSLSFNIVPSTGTATLTNSTMSPKDLSGTAFKNTGLFTPWFYFPSSTAYTGFTLRFGSDASNYHQISSTTQIDGSAFTTGWNQIGFDWLNATTVGTPVDSSLTYMQVSITFPLTIGTQTGLRLSDCQVRQRRLFNVNSTTDYLVIDSVTGLPKEQFTNSSDTSSYFNCERSFVDFLLYEILEQVFTTHANDIDARNYYMQKRMELEQDLIMRYPSQRQPVVGSYGDTQTHDSWLKR